MDAGAGRDVIAGVVSAGCENKSDTVTTVTNLTRRGRGDRRDDGDGRRPSLRSAGKRRPIPGERGPSWRSSNAGGASAGVRHRPPHQPSAATIGVRNPVAGSGEAGRIHQTASWRPGRRTVSDLGRGFGSVSRHHTQGLGLSPGPFSCLEFPHHAGFRPPVQLDLVHLLY